MTSSRELVALAALLVSTTAFGEDKLQYVNPFVGTDAHGHTFPGATVPFGMVHLSPDTRVEGWDACGGYHYSDSTVLGFSHTHLSGTGVADYGDILLLPTTGTPNILSPKSRFNHHDEQALPGYYSVILQDYGIKVELTASQRVGVHRYTFLKPGNAGVVLNLQHGLGPDRVIDSELHIVGDREITGYRRSTGWAKDQLLYFVAQFSAPFDSIVILESAAQVPSQHSGKGTDVRAYVRLSPEMIRSVVVKVALSSVSIDGARRNLAAEVPHWSFDRVRKEAARSWNAELTKIDVEGGTAEQRRTFYTAFYHSLLAPNVFSDVDGNYRGMDGTIHVARGFDMHTVFSLWDTFRAEHPLLSIIDRKRTLGFVRSMLAKHDEAGVLPVWELASNETWCMIGYHSVPVIVDAYLKGIDAFDHEKAFSAMTHSATLDHFGLKHYRAHGYIPGDKESESVSKTLEYAYDDWCIAQMANALHKTDEYKIFSRRAQYYRNVFDASTGFMRAKENEIWVEPFDPAAVTFHYTEANAWQYNFFVPHDIDGMIALHRGREAFVRKLDSLFYSSSDLRGRDQSDITGLIGQYAQGNEPSHHVAYLYNYTGAPWKTQTIVRHLMDSLFTSKPDGLCGNDDCGQMSAWYVMSAIGLYQVCPGQPLYAIGSPLFNKVTMRLENGKRFTLRTGMNSASRPFIQSATLNGKRYSKSYLLHTDIANGGSLELSMSDVPSITWASQMEDSPHSLSQRPIVTVPYAIAPATSFRDSMVLALGCSTADATIMFTTTTDSVTSNLIEYMVPIVLRASTSIKAYAVKDGSGKSEPMNAEFTLRPQIGSITLNTQYSSQYTAGGNHALIDGLRGGNDFRVGRWQGYQGTDLDVIVDLGTIREISSVALGCLQDVNSWIFFPSEVSFAFADDSKKFSAPSIVGNDVPQRDESSQIREFRVIPNHIAARYINVRAKNVGMCPDWHRGAGHNAWLFVDEISLKFSSR